MVEHLSYNFVVTKKFFFAIFNNFLFITICRNNKTLCHDINFRTIGVFNVATWELFVATLIGPINREPRTLQKNSKFEKAISS